MRLHHHNAMHTFRMVLRQQVSRLRVLRQLATTTVVAPALVVPVALLVLLLRIVLRILLAVPPPRMLPMVPRLQRRRL